MTAIRNYKQAKRYLRTFKNETRLRGGPKGYALYQEDLIRFRRLLEANGAPQLQYSAIHVAGTKGKGSTTAFLETMLRHSGIRTGRFTSPKIYERTEELTVNGEDISQADFAAMANEAVAWNRDFDRKEPGAPGVLGEAWNAVYDMFQRRKSPRKHGKKSFEITTTMGVLYYARKNVEVAVIETGLGGLVDPTNIFHEPPRVPGAFHLNVITPMGLEHVQILGQTMPEILSQKIGIIMPHALTILAPQQEQFAQEVRRTVFERAREVGQPEPLDAAETLIGEPLEFGATCRAVFRSNSEKLREWASGARLKRPGLQPIESTELFQALEKGLELEISLAGRHQIDNMRTVLATLICCQMEGANVSVEGIRKGAASTQWPGRFEVLCRDPLIVVDVAHEALSSAALGQTYRDMYGDRETVALCGFERDKDGPTILRNVAKHVNFVTSVCCSSPMKSRSRPAKKSKNMVARELKVPVTVSDPVPVATKLAVSMIKPGQALLVFGSFYIIAEAKATIQEMFPAP